MPKTPIHTDDWLASRILIVCKQIPLINKRIKNILFNYFGSLRTAILRFVSSACGYLLLTQLTD